MDYSPRSKREIWPFLKVAISSKPKILQWTVVQKAGPVPVVSYSRRSLGSMAATNQEYVIHNRRNSHSHTFGMGVVSSDVPRVRRRSHEPRDSEREILQNLQTAGRYRIGEEEGGGGGLQ